MNRNECSVSLHPYFKVHADKLAAAKVLLRAFIAKTAPEWQAPVY